MSMNSLFAVGYVGGVGSERVSEGVRDGAAAESIVLEHSGVGALNCC